MTRRSKESIRRRLEANPKPHQTGLGPTRVSDLPDVSLAGGFIRFSRIMSLLPSDSPHRAEFNAEREAVARCEKHGKDGVLADPIVLVVNSSDPKQIRALYCCPWCSDPKVLAQWESEALS